jgi:type III restriction enzyme
MMKLQFDANQRYQLDAVKAVVDLFQGQPGQGSSFRIEQTFPDEQKLFKNDFVVGNYHILSDDLILYNLRDVQRENGIDASDKLEGPHFSLEMETGTGKTYVYLRTIHELYKTYGFKKFIIVVPSLAIKEGVLKNLVITQEHFAMLYEKPEMDFYVYDPKKRGLARNFAVTNSVQILVMNIDQFARAGNVILKDSDWGIPIQYIQSIRPIVIVDEPQNMETENRKQAIDNLNPLCTLRYSATHKFHYNLIYKLDPVRAYDLGLVKRISVDGIEREDAFNQAYIELKSVQAKKGIVSAKIRIDSIGADGIIKKECTVRTGADLFELSGGRDIYKDGFIVDEIDNAEQSITFANGSILYAGQTQGGLTDDVMKFQIESTIRNHLDKEKKLQGRGIKVLSLFFIDRVANYRDYSDDQTKKGKIAQWFEEYYTQLTQKPVYKGLLPFSVEQVHNGYFSQDKKGILKDTGGDTVADDDTYELIMRDKERLLDVNEPLRFIFSHSALREGWDNPNVFQICTLNETQSTMKKRQEIGRGLRLPVDQNGQRVFDQQVNVLTVCANESYEDFARTLQKEIEDDCGVEFGKERIKNNRKRKRIRLNKQLELDPNFKALWEKIKHKTRYRVDYSTAELIKKSAKDMSAMTIHSPKLVSRKARIDITKTGTEATLEKETFHTIQTDQEGLPDILGYIQGKTNLTRDTILKMIIQSGKLADISRNPQQFMDLAVHTILRNLQEMMIDGIKYEKIAGEYWEQKQFENDELEAYLDELYAVRKQDKTIYNYVEVDSDIERDFAKELEDREEVKFYIKLPFWFKIQTPIGEYNPDWAIVFENDRRIYFVAETKGTTEIEKLTPPEQQKIRCGRKHFEIFDGVEFKAPIKTVSQLVK